MKDYKNVTSKVKVSASKTKPAGASRKKSAKKPRPGWLTLSYGLVLGVGVMMFINYLSSPDEATSSQKSDKTAVPENAVPILLDPGWAEVENTAKHYGFYETLPGAKVEIPDSEIKERQAKIAPQADIDYILQAGSFRAFREADSVKAQLALLSIESTVEPVVSKGVEWYRVRIGPFSNARDMNRVRNRVQRNKIETLVIKVPK